MCDNWENCQGGQNEWAIERPLNIQPHKPYYCRVVSSALNAVTYSGQDANFFGNFVYSFLHVGVGTVPFSLYRSPLLNNTLSDALFSAFLSCAMRTPIGRRYYNVFSYLRDIPQMVIARVTQRSLRRRISKRPYRFPCSFSQHTTYSYLHQTSISTSQTT
jgi:hypothetical protein